MTQEPLPLDSTAGEIVRHGARCEQDAQLQRVSSGIASHVLDFFKSRGVGSEFHASDLAAFVEERVGYVSPGSPDRILRDLRKRRLLNYTVVSRSKSLYRVERVS